MPLLPLSIAFILGVVLASFIILPAVYWLAASLIFLLLTVLTYLRIRKYLATNTYFVTALFRFSSPSPPLFRFFFPLLCLTILALGAARYQTTRPILSDPDFIAHYNDAGLNVTITGLLIQPPDERDTYTNLRIQTESLRLADDLDPIPVSGLMLARVDPDGTPGGDYQYGDRLTLTGQLQTPPENETFSYRDYLARSGVYAFLPFADAGILAHDQGSPIYKTIFALKAKALETVYQIFPDPEASLLAGILLGVETGIPPDLDQAFRDTGTAHIVAISGFNISILAALFMSVFGRAFGMRAGATIAIIAIGFYTLLVGADAAVVRAAIMGTLAIYARQSNQSTAALGTLFTTAAIMVFHNPLIPWDAGFQLSFFATFGLVFYADRFNKSFFNFSSRYLPLPTVEKIAPFVGDFFLLTFAAQLTTLPIVLYHFQRLSLISIIANPFILPVQPLVMILGGIAVLAGMIFLPLGQLIAPLAWGFVAYTIRVVEILAKIPGGVIATGQFSILAVIGVYFVLFFLTLVVVYRRNQCLIPMAAVIFLGLITVLTWQIALSSPDSNLHLTLLDTGMGEAILVETPTGRRLLIGGGTSPIRLSDNLGRRIVYGQPLDFLVVASPEQSSIAALPNIVERFSPANVLWAGPLHTTSSSRFLHRTIVGLDIPIISAEPGHALVLGNGAVLQVLSVGQRGAVLLLEWDNFRALLPIGLDFEAMDSLEMGRALGPVSLLLLAQSGSAPLNPPTWINHLNPQLILLSVEPGNRERLPSPETLDTVVGYNFLRTDLNGWIEVTTDGEQMWVEVERK